MTRHHLHLREVGRANLAVALGLVWSAVAVCLLAACVYDISHWVDAW